MNLFNRYNPDPTGKLCYGGGDIGLAAQATLQAASNVYSWRQAVRMPKLQAEANEKVLKAQKKDYDKITDKQRRILTNAIQRYLRQIDRIVGTKQHSALRDAYGEVPKAATFRAYNVDGSEDVAIGAQNRLVRNNTFATRVNRLHEQNDLIHILSMDPRFMVTLDVHNHSIQDLVRGVLPVGDVVEIVGDAAEQASMLGRIGNTRKTTARDLGISKLRAQAAGRRELRESVVWMNSAVSPLSRQQDLSKITDTRIAQGFQRVSMLIHQSELIYQALQNKYTLHAQKSPYKMARLELRLSTIITRLQANMNKALLTNNFVPNYASTIIPKTDNTAGLVGAIGQAVGAANASHFFGGPGTQDGYVGGRTAAVTPANLTTEHNASDRPTSDVLKYSGAGTIG